MDHCIAALDRRCVPDSPTFVDAQWDSIQLALREASLVVVTHEHHDHAVGIVRSPFLEQIRSHTMLTASQLESLREHPNDPCGKLDSNSAGSYLVVDYDSLLPIAPGVALALSYVGQHLRRVAERIADALEIRLSADEHKRVSRKPTDDARHPRQRVSATHRVLMYGAGGDQGSLARTRYGCTPSRARSNLQRGSACKDSNAGSNQFSVMLGS
jgi:hypothetical protein